VFEANRFAAAFLWKILQHFSRLAIKYKQEYGKVPVLIIDDASLLVQGQQSLLNLFQDYAADTADKGIASVVFMFSESRGPRRMIGELTMFCSLIMLIKCYREKLVVKKWKYRQSW
jgi:hypothetical protein